MITFAGKGILLDLEGTTAPLRFVQDVLIPYARRHLSVFLRYLWNDPAMPRLREEFARYFGAASFHLWTGGDGMPPEHRLTQFRQALLALMDQDTKVAPLLELQGLIWREGYRDGTLRSQVYGEVIRNLKDWYRLGLDVRIFSSGSVEAQKLFFSNVDLGTETSLNLTEYLRGFYDTTLGSKREPDSYRKIARAFNLPADELLFLSDTAAELDAARRAGFQTAFLHRPDCPAEDHCEHPCIKSFDEIVVKKH
jgi:enolase-phosphatase E1